MLEHLPNWSEEQAERALLAAEAAPGSITVEDKRPAEPPSDIDEEWGKPEMAPLPEGWGRLPSGAPAPNWVAGLDEVRRGR